MLLLEQSETAITEAEIAEITAEIRRGGPEVIEEIAVAWRDLWNLASRDPFYRPEWILAYLRSFKSKPIVWLVKAFRGKQLIAVLPLVKEAGLFRGIPVRQLRGAACVHSCRFDLLRVPGALGIAATKAIWDALEHTRGWDLIQIPFTPKDGNAIELVQHAEKRGLPTAADLASRSRYIRIVHSSDGKLHLDPQLNSHFRSELRRHARRLEEMLGARPEFMILREPNSDWLQRFYALEASGWKGREGTAIKSRADTRMFYDEIARIGATLGCFRLAVLEANGRMVAGAFGMAISNTFIPLKIGYDETLSRGAPGNLLFERILSRCSDEGLTELEFGGDDEHYKSLWTPLTRDYLRSYIFRRGEYGRLLQFHKLVVVPWFKRMLSQAGKRFKPEAMTRNDR